MNEIKKNIPDEEKEQETKEWLESLEYVLRSQGPERVKEILSELDMYAHEFGVELLQQIHLILIQYPKINSPIIREVGRLRGE